MQTLEQFFEPLYLGTHMCDMHLPGMHMHAINSMGTAFNLLGINEHCLMFHMYFVKAHATPAVQYIV